MVYNGFDNLKKEKMLKSKDDILAELEDKLRKDFVIDSIQWGRDDCGIIML